LLAQYVLGGPGPSLPSQMWTGVLAPLLSGVVRIRLGDCYTRMPPHFALAIIFLLIRVQLISLFATPTSHAVQRKIRRAPIMGTVFVDSTTLDTPALHSTRAV
jgi:thiamine transporter ThiT